MEHCLTCRMKINGRADKKFCDDSCRTRYHNAKNKQYRNLFGQYHRILALNYNVLKFAKKHKALQVSHLERLGFRSQFHTQIKEKSGKIYAYLCYDIMYTIKKDKVIILSNS